MQAAVRLSEDGQKGEVGELIKSAESYQTVKGKLASYADEVKTAHITRVTLSK